MAIRETTASDRIAGTRERYVARGISEDADAFAVFEEARFRPHRLTSK